MKPPSTLTKACLISLQTIKYLRRNLKVGITEKELALLAKQKFLYLGADKLSFPTIIAFGPNSASPHHKPTSRQLKQTDTVLIDLGAKIGDSCADFSRTFFIGKPTPFKLKIRRTVMAAYRASLKLCIPGNRCTKIDNSARSVIIKAGFAKYFIHGTGHGVGHKVHMAPKISPKSNRYLKPGMVITIEPGIYIPNKFGFRYENTILIKHNSAQELM